MKKISSIALLILMMFGCNQQVKKQVKECSPQSMGLMSGRIASANDFQTVKDGKWSDTSVWAQGRVPDSEAYVIVSNLVELDTNSLIKGLAIAEGGTLKFKDDASTTLKSKGNVVVYGTLIMTPDDFSVVQTIKFINVNESAFVGGGMDIMDTDVGLWVRGAGSLNLKGTYKTAWSCLGGAAMKGNKTISCIRPPTGWQVGDEISIAPTTPTSVSSYVTGFDVRKIKAIDGSTITLDTALTFDHPKVTTSLNSAISFTAEIANLTRNVRIEGTGNGNVDPETNGRAHINIGMVTSMSSIENVQLRNLGPRKRNTSNIYTSEIIGRYALHFHHCNDALRGMIVSGVVVRDCGSHAFVPHDSHGITFKNDISHNTFDEAFWWDAPTAESDTSNNSNFVSYDSCLSELLRCDPTFRGYRLTNFYLGSGVGNSVTNCVAVGNQGNLNGCGYLWPEASNYTPNTWFFLNNLSHNGKADGIFTWQNDSSSHPVAGFTAYRHGMSGIEHGAYVNGFKYIDALLFENKKSGVYLHATPSINAKKDSLGYHMSFYSIISSDSLYIAQHTLRGTGPVLFKDCKFPGVVVSELPRRMSFPAPGIYDLINCNIEPNSFRIIGIEEGSLWRVQRADGSAFQLNDKKIVTVIPKFK